MITIRKTVILNILMLAAFTNRAYGALYTVENKGDSPITVKMDLANDSGWIAHKTLTAQDLQPGQTTQLNAGGGKHAYIIYLIKPGKGKDLPLIPLANVKQWYGKELSGKYYNPNLRGDQTIEFGKRADGHWGIYVH